MTDLMGPGEVLAHCEFKSRSDLKYWREHGELPFPEPIAQLQMGPVWDGEAVRKWKRKHKRRRKPTRKRYPLPGEPGYEQSFGGRR